MLVDRTLFHVHLLNPAAAHLFGDSHRQDALLTDLLAFGENGPAAAFAGLSGRIVRAVQGDDAHACLLQPLDADWLLVQLLPEIENEPRPDGPETASGRDREIENLKRVSQRKSELIANISHELRTPLTAILGWPEIILDAPDMPALALQAAQAIRKDGIFLRQLLDDLIDLSRIEAGYLQLDIHSEDIGQIVLDAVEMLAEKARGKNLSLSTELPEQTVRVAADAVRLLQVVLNYLANAIKYTDPGGEIAIAVRTEGEEAILSLRDSGIGMNESVRQHIFERFMRADEVQSTDGAGIGLSLVKKLVALHGGRCWVESEPGQGSTFYLSVPLARSQAGDALRARGASPASHPGRLAQLRLLILDERPEELSLLEQLLLPYFRLVHGLGRLPAPEELAADRPDLILLSTSLQDAHHPAWLQSLRGHKTLASMPVVALSASAMKGDAEKLQALGFSGSLSKPFLKEDLLQYLQSLLARTSHA